MLGTTAALVPSLVLLLAGAGHLHDQRGFAEAVRAQQLLRGALAAVLAWAMPFLEVALGLAGVASTVLGPAWFGQVSMAALAAVYSSYTAYGWALVHLRPGAPCACAAGSQDPATMAAVGRAAALASLALVALFALPGADLAGRELAVVLLAAVTYALAIWCLPTALRLPNVPEVR